jgi:hypothetical protein
MGEDCGMNNTKAIEAAAEAMARHEIDDYGQRDVEIYIPLATVAIAAYQAASGEARDAARYREFRNNFGLAVWGEDGQIAWHEDEIDAAIDAAIAAREGVNDE